MGRHHQKYSHNKCIHKCAIKPKCRCEPVPPWSDTNELPDAQWCPVIPIHKPLKIVQIPFYTSSEDPTPEWAPNVVIYPPYHKRQHQYEHRFLKTCFHDTVPMYVYGTNPYSNTVNSSGSHFQ